MAGWLPETPRTGPGRRYPGLAGTGARARDRDLPGPGVTHQAWLLNTINKPLSKYTRQKNVKIFFIL